MPMDESTKPAEESVSELAPVSLQARIPHFWRENPRLWFAQFEAVVAAHKLGEEQKYNLVIPVLDRADIEQISDIIISPPPSSERYSTLKNRLISVYQESEHRQLQKLLSGLELGDQKPTQLLRRMRDLGGPKFPDDALKVMWMNHIPAQIRAVLSVNTESSLDCLANMADKMIEHTETTIATVNSTPSTSSSSDTQYQLLSKQIEKLTLEIAELQRASRTNYRRPFHSRRRSRSRSRTPAGEKRKPGDANWECHYHYRFGDKAKRCTSPCSRKKSEN